MFLENREAQVNGYFNPLDCYSGLSAVFLEFDFYWGAFFFSRSFYMFSRFLIYRHIGINLVTT